MHTLSQCLLTIRLCSLNESHPGGYACRSTVAFLSQHEARARCKSCNSPLVLPNLGRCQDVSCCTLGEAVSTSVRQKHISWVRRVVCANDSISILPLQNLPWKNVHSPPYISGRTRSRSLQGGELFWLFFFFWHPIPLKSVGIAPQVPWGAAWRGRNIKRELMWENTHMQALFCLVPKRWLAANADLVKTTLTGGAIGVANTPGEATVTKTLTKRISVSLCVFWAV